MILDSNPRFALVTTLRIVTATYMVAVGFVIVSATMNWFPDAFGYVKERVSDKVLHFVLVGMLAFFLNLSLRNRCWRAIQLGTLVVGIAATAEEFSQLAFVNRTFDLLDLACNLLGILVLGTLAWPLGKRLSLSIHQ